jgi:drug/metabolite transporter (DMT)-like permease
LRRSKGIAMSAPTPPDLAIPQIGFLARLNQSPSSGIIWVVLGVFLFTCMDALAKYLVQTTPTLQVVWARYATQAVVIIAILAPRGRSAPLRTRHPISHVIRAMFQVAATGFFFLSLGYIGLAEATALADINPVLITLGAALFLGERLTRARILAVLAALAGAMIILRPGSEVYTPAALLPLGCAVAYAGNALMTRYIGQSEPVWTSLFYGAVFGTALLSCALPFVWQPIVAGQIWLFVALGLIGTGAQTAIILAFSRSEAGVLAPFGYLGIIFAAIFSTLIYNQPPDMFTIIGALVIIGAGLYVWGSTHFAARNLAQKP